MFEDLLGRRSIRKKADSILNDEACPTCGSTYVKTLCGFFKSADRYIHILICDTCGQQWTIIYDGNLNIIDTQIGD